MERLQPRTIAIIISIVLLAFVGIGFQNCSQVNFSNSDLASLGKDSGPMILIENGRPATNKRVLSVEFKNLRVQYTEMRIAEEGQFSDNLPWVPFQQKSNVDLFSAFAGDGSQDTDKVIIAQVRVPKGTALELKGQILLDTVPPTGSATGLMARGLQGEAYKKGDHVNLEWSAADVPSRITNRKSDLDPNAAIRLAHSSSADCGATDLQFDSDWMRNSNSYSAFTWPTSAPLDTFYICVLVRDLAGNQSTILSQPMTSIWRVLAGDNNPGNGGSALAPNVRFMYPTELAVDSKGRLYIFDSYAFSIRRISEDGTISRIMGGGIQGAPKAGLADASPLHAGVFALSFDSQDRLYIATSSGIWRLYKNSADGKDYVELITDTSVAAVAMTIKRKPDGDILYIGSRGYIPNRDGDPFSANAYIFEIPLSAVESANPKIGIQALRSNYIFAGNGAVWPVAAQPDFSPHDSKSSPIGYINSLAVDSAGSVYFSTNSDGSGIGWCGPTLQVIQKDGSGNYKTYVLSHRFDWGASLDVVESGSRKELLFGGYTGGRRVDLKNLNLPLTQDLPDTFAPGMAEPAYALIHSKVFDGAPIAEPIFYGADSRSSRVLRYQSNFTLDATFGRPVFKSTETSPLTAMVNTPTGTVEDKNGNFYFYEVLSNIVRRLTPEGKLDVYAGKPYLDPTYNYSSPFKDVTLESSSFLSGYQYPLYYDNTTDSLFLSMGAQAQINRFSISTGVHRRYDLAGGQTQRETAPESWPIYSLALSPTTADPDVFVFGYRTLYPYHSIIEKMTVNGDNFTISPVAGNQAVAPVVPGPAMDSPLPNFTGSVVDGSGAYFFAASGNLYRLKDGVLKTISPFSGISLALFEEGGKKHFVSSGQIAITHLVLNDDDTVASPAETLCLPGTYLNMAYGISKSRDGNLFVSDTRNGRILKYNVRNPSGNLTFFNSSCK